LEAVFSGIYQRNERGGSESIAGPGSDMASTRKLRLELPGVLRSLGVRRVVAAPCGDMNWMRHLEYEFDLLIGVDIVPELIRRLRTRFPTDKFHFQTANICEDILPRADAVICRDFFGHLSFADIRAAIRLLKQSGAQFLLTTTFPERENRDIDTGGWRQINLQAAPFLWPGPIALIRENSPDHEDVWTAGKSLGVWPLDSILV
jgi:hypothetical protein